jgi:DNA modification methylase
LIWCKQNFCFWPGARYQQQHELIFIARREGEQIIDNVPSNQGTVFNIDRKKKNNIHPTQKPLELFEKLLLNHTNRDDIVYEPFGGSGTTLITCEKNNRKCRVIEISPQFCQVIIDRWEKYINAKATKIN